MRYLAIAILSLVVLFSCKKWVDPPPQNDPRLTNPYCDDPMAVNYNQGFPGKPDNTVCLYPTDRFVGTYRMYDSTYSGSTGLLIGSDSFIINISKINFTQVLVTGMCTGGNNLTLTTGKTLTATVDTTVGDTLSAVRGQIFCKTTDTVTGTFTRDFLNEKLLFISLQVVGDTSTSFILGRAIKQ